MTSQPVTPQRRRHRLRWKFALLLVVTGGACGLLELLFRGLDGYHLFALRLRHVLQDAPPEGQLDYHRELVAKFVQQEITPRTDLDAAWLRRSPAPVPRHPVPPDLERRFRDYPEKVFLYQVNEVLLRASWEKGVGVKPLQGIPQPDSFYVFTPPDGKPFPQYRYPPSTTLPTGITTNAFGFRGREVALNKPAGVIRIACVGASTTVDHTMPISYPEFLEPWLELYAQARGLSVHFEVLNAGREAVRSPDIRAIVEEEVLPLAVDYVVYYEGANQFSPANVQRNVHFATAQRLAQPPDGLVPDFEEHGHDLTLLDRVCEFSASARRFRSVLHRNAVLREPEKPSQELQLPAGLDEQHPDLARAGEVLDLGTVLGDLGAINSAVNKAGARLVLCSFCWLVYPGLELDGVFGRNAFIHLNRLYWPFRYDVLRRLADLQNRFFAQWAAQNAVDFCDVAVHMPQDARLYFDAHHNSELGVRLKAWLVFADLVRLIERDVAAGRVPVPDRVQETVHPNLGPARLLTARELDGR